MSGLSRVGAHEASQDTWHSQTLNHHPGSAALKSAMACSSPVAGEVCQPVTPHASPLWGFPYRSEEHTSELQSLMRISYAVFCLKKKNITHTTKNRLHRPSYSTNRTNKHTPQEST